MAVNHTSGVHGMSNKRGFIDVVKAIGKNCAVGLKVVFGGTILKVSVVRSVLPA
jgi:hypothetical protein